MKQQISIAEHEAIQSEVVGDGKPLEVRIEKRLLNVLRLNPGITASALKNRCGFRLNPVVDSVISRLIEDGAIDAKAVKLELKIREAR